MGFLRLVLGPHFFMVVITIFSSNETQTNWSMFKTQLKSTVKQLKTDNLVKHQESKSGWSEWVSN